MDIYSACYGSNPIALTNETNELRLTRKIRRFLCPCHVRKKGRPACDRTPIRFQLFDTAAAFGPSLDLEIVAQGAGGQLQATLIRCSSSGRRRFAHCWT